ncbi:sortase [Candidatus Peribacteria bacterium]|nr:sortase [Candidatus Peribacteria bacterium]
MPKYNSERAQYAEGGIIKILPGDSVLEHVDEIPEISLIEEVDEVVESGKANTREEIRSIPEAPVIKHAKGTLRFAGTFASVFAFLFIALNFSSFSQIFTAWLMPESLQLEASALEIVTKQDALPLPPSLPTAGASIEMITVSPPDNRLVIPKIGKNIPLVEVSDAALKRQDWKTFEKDVQHALRFGAVRYPGTAEPGQVGNIFITGHSSYYPWDFGGYKDVFVLLHTLEIGDKYSIYYEGDIHHYLVSEKYEVSPRDVSVLEQPDDKFSSMLMTCSPVGTTLKRLIVRADEINSETNEIIEVVTESPFDVNLIDWGGELAI